MDPLEPVNSHGPIKVALIEDDVTYRSCVLLVLRRAKGIVCTHVFSSCEEALRILQPGDAPDVLLLDLQLPGISGTDGISQLRALNPSIRIVVLTISEQENEVFRAIYEGAAGYLLKSDSTAKVAEAIIQASAGGSPLTPRIAKLVLERFARSNVDSRTHTLTQRERDIFKVSSAGPDSKSNRLPTGPEFSHDQRPYSKDLRKAGRLQPVCRCSQSISSRAYCLIPQATSERRKRRVPVGRGPCRCRASPFFARPYCERDIRGLRGFDRNCPQGGDSEFSMANSRHECHGSKACDTADTNVCATPE